MLWLNADALTVTRAAVAGRTSPIRVLSGHDQFVGFAFDPPLPAGRHRLTLSYEAEQSRNSTRGIFALQDAGAWYAMTHFEPTSARRAFPCFDEPSLQGSVAADAARPTRCRRVLEHARRRRARRRSRHETGPLPRDAAAAVVSRGVRRRDRGKRVNLRRVGMRPTPMRVIVPKGRRADASFAAGAYPPIFEHTERWFGIAHPYEKLDHIAIPLTVGFAMENAGLITYGAPTLLAKPGRDIAEVPTRRGEHRRARDRAPVVRQSGEPDVVGRPLAERGVRDLVRGEDRRPLAAGLRARHGARARARRRDEGGRARYRAPHPRADRRRMATSARRSIRSPTRRARRSSACSRAGSASRRFAAASSRYLRARSDGNATTQRLPRCVVRGQPPSGRAGVLDVPRPERRPAGGRDARLREPAQADAHARAATARCRSARRRCRRNAGRSRYAFATGPARPRSRCARCLRKRRQRCRWQGACPRYVFANAGGKGYYLPEYRGDLLDRLARNRACAVGRRVHERSLRPARAGARRIGGRARWRSNGCVRPRVRATGT